MPDARAPDLLFLDADLRMVPDGHAPADALAVSGDRISAVGRSAELARLAGPGTRVIRMHGRTLVPGFQDAHVHPISAGIEAARCPLTDLHDPGEIVDRIRSYATANPELEWVVGGGWTISDFPDGRPHRDLLDTAVGDRPAFFDNRDGHDAWVSSAALRRAGIGPATPDPADGRIARDPDGSPMGTLHEGAMELVRQLIPEPTLEERIAGLRWAQAYLHGLGITAWQDANVDPVDDAAYRAVADAGALTARVVGSLEWDHHGGLEQIDGLVASRARGPAGRYRPGAVKLFMDGIVESRTAAVIEPYLDPDGAPTGGTGLQLIEPALLRAVVTRLDTLGFQVHVHAIGERAVRNALDAFEAARRANGRTDGRHHIAHLQVVHPDDVPRFGRLDVTANAQALWACNDPVQPMNDALLGSERAGWQYPFRSIVRAGGRLALGSDWSVTTPDPFAIMETAVTRVDVDDRSSAPFLPGEAITLDEALHAYTAGSGHLNHLDDAGWLAPGCLADLAVLDRRLGSASEGPIAATRVAATIVGGIVVHDTAALEG
jgi:predicted amidohydrolase YtcJ